MVSAEEPTPELLIGAYCRGIFPMSDAASGELAWYSPDPRAVLPLAGLRVSRSLERTVRSARFRLSTDRAFEQVMRACAAPGPGRETSWIDGRLVALYCELHRLGFAHSVEAWSGARLVGGLYGVHIQSAFFGESMFSRPEQGGRDASKVCLVALARALERGNFRLHDVQFMTPHLERFGAFELPRARYLRQLARALEQPARWPVELLSSPEDPSGN